MNFEYDDKQQPHYSDDGRFFWTGTQWLPVRPTSLDQATGLVRFATRLAMWWMALWAVIVLIAMFWRWILGGAVVLIVMLIALGSQRDGSNEKSE